MNHLIRLCLAAIHRFIYNLEIFDTVLGIIGVSFILCGALVFQWVFKQQPCPLCLLQRAAFINVGLALFLNLRFGNRAWHWGLAILSAFTGMCVSIRQILLHITTTEGFGGTVFGLHLYTWSFLAFALVIVGSAFLLTIYPERILFINTENP